MRKILMVILILVSAVDCYAADNVVQNSVSTITSELANQIREIRNKVKAIDPSFDASIDNLSSEQQLQALKSYLSEKAFSDYKEKYIDLLNQQSAATGRQVKQLKKGNEEILWLDRGALDSDSCYNPQSNQACDYPDGFVDFEIIYQDFGTTNTNASTKTLSVSYDDPSNNLHQDVDIALSAVSGSDGTSSTTGLSVYSQSTDYDEYQVWRNQEMADIRSGKYTAGGQSPAGLEGLNTESRTLRYVSDDRMKWLSNYFPDAVINGSAADIN